MGEMEKRLLLFFGVTFVLVSLWPRIFPAPRPPEPIEPPMEDVREVEPGGNAPPPRDVNPPSPETEDAEAAAFDADGRKVA